jgi:hypothetical protein
MIALIFFMDLDPAQASGSYVHWAVLYEIYTPKNVSKVPNPHNLKNVSNPHETKKGSPVDVPPACARSGEGSDHFWSYVRSLSLHFCERLFL